jgi:hypothetical protein
MHRTGIRTTPFLSRARWAIALLLAGALATPAMSQTKGYAYTYCQAVVNHGNMEAFQLVRFTLTFKLNP